MPYSLTHIRDLSLGQLSKEELAKSLVAFNGFAQLFSEKWVDDCFGPMKSPRLVKEVSQFWDWWETVENLKGAKEILKRWKYGMRALGVSAEVQIAANLVQKGIEVELFPIVRNRTADFRIRTKGSQWIYLEVSKRGLSEIGKHSNDVLNKVSVATGIAAPGMHGKIGISREITDRELHELLDWLSKLKIEAGRENESRFSDFALFHTDKIESGGGDSNDLSNIFVPQPKMFAVNFRMENNIVKRKGTGVIHLEDNAAQRVLETEASQLPTDKPGIVILNISQVVDGMRYWEPLILRRFQPTINTRISAVILSARRAWKQSLKY